MSLFKHISITLSNHPKETLFLLFIILYGFVLTYSDSHVKTSLIISKSISTVLITSIFSLSLQISGSHSSRVNIIVVYEHQSCVMLQQLIQILKFFKFTTAKMDHNRSLSQSDINYIILMNYRTK